MRTLAIAAAFALIGTAAGAQMNTTHTTTTTPMGTATTTERTHTDGMSGRTDQRVTTRTMHTTMHRTVASARTHCKTWWKHGRKMRSCKTMVHRHG